MASRPWSTVLHRVEVIADEVLSGNRGKWAANPRELSHSAATRRTGYRRDILAILSLTIRPWRSISWSSRSPTDGHDWRAEASTASRPTITGFEARCTGECSGRRRVPRWLRSGETDVEQFRVPSASGGASYRPAMSSALRSSPALPARRAFGPADAGATAGNRAAQWWRPLRPTTSTAWPRPTLEALDAGVVGAGQSIRCLKKAELASAAGASSPATSSASRGRGRAQAWVPRIMRFTDAEEVAHVDAEVHVPVSDDATDEIAGLPDPS